MLVKWIYISYKVEIVTFIVTIIEYGDLMELFYGIR